MGPNSMEEWYIMNHMPRPGATPIILTACRPAFFCLIPLVLFLIRIARTPKKNGNAFPKISHGESKNGSPPCEIPGGIRAGSSGLIAPPRFRGLCSLLGFISRSGYA